MLADGSVVELNANSEVSVELLPQERRVSLRLGEAHFTVAPQIAEHGDALARRSFELMALRTPHHSLAEHTQVAASRATLLRRWQPHSGYLRLG